MVDMNTIAGNARRVTNNYWRRRVPLPPQNNARISALERQLKSTQNSLLRSTRIRNAQKRIIQEKINQLQQRLKQGLTPTQAANAVTQTTQAVQNIGVQTHANTTNVTNRLKAIENSIRRIQSMPGGGGIHIQIGSQTQTMGGGGAPPPPPQGEKKNNGGGGAPPPPPQGEKKNNNGGGAPPPNPALNKARRTRNLMYTLVNQYTRGELTRKELNQRFGQEEYKNMIRILHETPNFNDPKFRNYVRRMDTFWSGANTSVESRVLYAKVQKMVQQLRTESERGKNSIRNSLRALKNSKNWNTMKRNMKYAENANVRRTINVAEFEVRGLLRRIPGNLMSLIRRSPASIATRLANAKKRYNVARTQTNRNALKKEIENLQEAQKLLVSTKNAGIQTTTPTVAPTTSRNGMYNENLNKVASIQDRVERVRRLSQLIRKYPSKRSEIQSMILQTVRKIYRDPPYGEKNANIQFNLEQVKRAIGGQFSNVNKELAYAIKRKVPTKSSSSNNNAIRAKVLASLAGKSSSSSNYGMPSRQMPMMMAPVAPAYAAAAPVPAPVYMGAPPPSVIQALPQPERIALNSAGGYRRAARIVENMGGPNVTERAIRVFERNKGNVQAAARNTGLPPKVFMNIKKLGGPITARRTLIAVKKVSKKQAPKPLAVRSKAKATTKVKTKATKKKQGVSTRTKRKRAVKTKLKTIISQIPRKNLEKNVLACVLP